MSSIVSSITGQRGGNAGGAGLNYNAAGAPILNTVTADQLAQAQNQSQQGLTQQQAFLQAVQGQNALQNQTNVYNQLQNVAAGTGPNPALAQLAQATGANTANQAALMAGQRGASANVGLIARQAAQQGAANQQQAAGQAATLQAQQQLGALGQLQGLTTDQANQLASATGAYTNATQNQQNILQNAAAAMNNANVGMVSNQNTANAGISGIAAQQQGKLLGGLTNAIGGGMASAFASGGPVMPSALMAQGGRTPPPTVEGATTQGPRSSFGQFLQNMSQPQNPAQSQDDLEQGSQSMFSGIGKGLKDLIGGGGDSTKGSAGYLPGGTYGDESALPVGAEAAPAAEEAPELAELALAARGGKVDALVSPGEKYLDREAVKKVAKGANPMAVGEKIPGKPKVSGSKDSYSNDTVPKKLETGGIVLPRSVTQAKDPAKAAHKFVSQIMAKQGTIPKRK